MSNRISRMFSYISENKFFLLLGIGIIIAIVIPITILTNVNPMILGSAIGVAVGVILPAIIFRLKTREQDKNSK